MGIVLLSQGAQEEAAATLFGNKEHELARRARRFRQVAEEEMDKDAEKVRRGDCWLHFGSGVFPRDARGLVVGGPVGQEAERWGQAGQAGGAGVSWVVEETGWVQGVREELEAMVGDVRMLAAPLIQLLREKLIPKRSRLLQVSAVLVLIISIVLAALLRYR
jgi:hypothetical protein